MIPVKQFLACVQENADRIHAYELGHDGSDGKCDCIGLIIGALALAGFRWPGVHGSNWAARNAMDTLEYITNTAMLFPGAIVYKSREPGHDKYALPSRYADSGDLRDYYHVGVVTGIDPLQITHCTSVPGGIAFDTKMGNWRWGGKLKYVDYNEGGVQMEPIYRAIVNVEENDYPVKMRAQPQGNAKILNKVPEGEIVDVFSNNGEWSSISYNGQTGYMMSKYLNPLNEDAMPNDEKTLVYRWELEDWAESLEILLDEIRDKLGRG